MPQYNPICPSDHCTACMACLNACQHKAIVLITDELGFQHPYINDQACTSCGLCHQVCPEVHPRTLTFPLECFAAAMKSQENLRLVASGGVASTLSIKVIEEGGVVCGCSGEDLPDAKHIIIDDISEVSKLAGSKYVQSIISPTLYSEIRKHLTSGRKVLFIGTGCQVAGLQNFLKKTYDNLITVDLVCHGVPSRQMLRQNMDLYEGLIPNSVKFREKISDASQSKPNGEAIRFGWFFSKTTHTECSTEIKHVEWNRDPYLAAFMDCLSFQDGCYNCRYAYSARQSDLTICDFWGLSNESTLHDSLGVSAILCNNAKGRATVETLRSIMDLEQRPIQEAIVGNGQLMHPSRKPDYRDKFRSIYREKGFIKAVQETAMQKMQEQKRYERRMHMLLLPYRLLSKIKTLIRR